MPKNITQYDLLISCPGDIQSELPIISDAIKAFNDTYSDVLGISLRTKHWTRNSYAQSGGKPQDLLNEQLVTGCDGAIALFWTRFGTPTDQFGSGTEEEIEEMLKAGKQVFLYFSDKSIPPSEMAKIQEQYEKIQEFKKRYQDRGLYFCYNSDDELKKLLIAHLGQHFLSIKAIEEINSKRAILSVKGILDGSLVEKVPVSLFYPANCMTVDKMLEETDYMFEQVDAYQIGRRHQVEAAHLGGLQFIEPVEIKEDTKDIINEYASLRALRMSDTFFSLGSLHENKLESMAATLNFDGGRPLNGEKEELKKYNAIIRLKQKITHVLNWLSLIDSYEKLRCIKLAVQNSGTTFDEDVEITLTFPRNILLMLDDFPTPDSDSLEYFLDECDADDFFGIPSTSAYLHYDSSQKQGQPYYPQTTSGFPYLGRRRNLSKEYKDTLEDTFLYNYYVEGDVIKVKLWMEYIKHNTTVAFPTVLFVTEAVADIQYSITSKHNENITEGTLSLE